MITDWKQELNISGGYADIIPISFTNSRFPCLDFEESSITAITVPSDSERCVQ
jgi:hypothetical protein